ncbi:MAG TPA: hypothetical protein VKU42_00080 [Candidatus Angelobacter sp.]|nr:hypothetical protein [Candidatus Angelobacter sp.]
MNSIDHFIRMHPYVLPAALYTGSVMVSNLPTPDTSSGGFYRWFYGTAHGIIGYVASIGKVVAPAQNGAGGIPPPISGMGAVGQQAKAASAGKYEV